MDWQVAFVLVLVVVVFFGFIRERLPADIVALLALCALLATGILDADDAFSVFGNPAPITVAAMFVLSAALERTGVIDGLGRQVSRLAGRSPAMAIVTMLGGVMVLSAFINNTPVVVLLTPVMFSLAATFSIAPSKLLMPLSFASIFGGTMTMIGTSTNILVDGVAQDRGLEPFGMFEITAAGAIMGVIGIAYLTTVGRWLLPERKSLASLIPSASDRSFLAEVLVPFGSPLVGKKLKGAGLTEEKGFQVVDVVRNEMSLIYQLDEIALEAGDRLVVRSKMGDVLGLREAGDVAFGIQKGHVFEPIASRETVVMEGVVGPQSRMIGRRVAALNLRRLYGAYILAIHRQGVDLTGNFDQVRMQMGDTLLLEGPPESMKRLFERQDLVNVMMPHEGPLRRAKAPIAIAAVLFVMVLSAFEVLPIAALALIAATAVVALGCLDAEDAYGAVHWNILMLIFAMLALGVAMEQTGAARLIVDFVGLATGSFGPIVVLSAIYLLTTILTEFMSNNAAAILLTPIAIGLANQLGVDPRPFAVAVMFAASASFATPIGYQTNTFVYGAGGYKFTDFVKVGLPLNILMWAAATILIPMFWPLG